MGSTAASCRKGFVTVDRYILFTDKKRSLVRVADKDVSVMNGFFTRMLEQELSKEHGLYTGRV